eukprot:6194896-Pleurochrysis_carterae.AAC.2
MMRGSDLHAGEAGEKAVLREGRFLVELVCTGPSPASRRSRLKLCQAGYMFVLSSVEEVDRYSTATVLGVVSCVGEQRSGLTTHTPERITLKYLGRSQCTDSAMTRLSRERLGREEGHMSDQCDGCQGRSKTQIQHRQHVEYRAAPPAVTLGQSAWPPAARDSARPDCRRRRTQCAAVAARRRRSRPRLHLALLFGVGFVTHSSADLDTCSVKTHSTATAPVKRCMPRWDLAPASRRRMSVYSRLPGWPLAR